MAAMQSAGLAAPLTAVCGAPAISAHATSGLPPVPVQSHDHISQLIANLGNVAFLAMYLPESLPCLSGPKISQGIDEA